MIQGSKELTRKILLSEDLFLEDRDAALQNSIKIIAEHFGVSVKDVEWRDFRKPGWHVDPPGRFYIKGKPLKMHTIITWDARGKK